MNTATPSNKPGFLFWRGRFFDRLPTHAKRLQACALLFFCGVCLSWSPAIVLLLAGLDQNVLATHSVMWLGIGLMAMACLLWQRQEARYSMRRELEIFRRDLRDRAERRADRRACSAPGPARDIADALVRDADWQAAVAARHERRRQSETLPADTSQYSAGFFGAAVLQTLRRDAERDRAAGLLNSSAQAALDALRRAGPPDHRHLRVAYPPPRSERVVVLEDTPEIGSNEQHPGEHHD